VKPLAVELFAGSFGWGAGFVAEGYRVVGFDIEHLPHHGPVPEGCSLVLQDVLTLHGSQFKDAAVIVASPPCQKYSWLAMPWSRSKSDHSKAAKALRREWETNGPDNRLFDACFRIQREAIEARHLQVCCGPKRPTSSPGSEHSRQDGERVPQARGQQVEAVPDGSVLTPEARRKPSEATAMQCDGECYIPLVIENVRGAQEWVGAAFYGLDAWMKSTPAERWRMGRSAWNFGSFHLWGDVPALMPISSKSPKVGGFSWSDFGKPGYKPLAFNGEAERRMREDGQKTQGGSWFRERNGVPQPGIRHEDRGGIKGIETDRATLPDGTGGTSWFGAGRRADPRDVRRNENGEYVNPDGTKIGGDWFSDPKSTCRKHGSRSSARKAASAAIARIPFELARHIAAVYKPRTKTPETKWLSTQSR